MDTVVTDIRALLRQFQQAALRDLHLRSQALEVFIARNDGSANPMLAGRPAADDARTTAISAPHLGLFEPLCAAGDVIGPGSIVARIDVLGRKTDVLAPEGGRITAVGPAANALVEYGEQLLTVSAAA